MEFGGTKSLRAQGMQPEDFCALMGYPIFEPVNPLDEFCYDGDPTASHFMLGMHKKPVNNKLVTIPDKGFWESARIIGNGFLYWLRATSIGLFYTCFLLTLVGLLGLGFYYFNVW